MQGINSADKTGLRKQLCDRWGGHCAYCTARVGLRRGTVDHYVPKALGGTNARRNLRWSCRRCNELKADMHPDDWAKVIPTLPRPPETAYQRKVRLIQAAITRHRQVVRAESATA